MTDPVLSWTRPSPAKVYDPSAAVVVVASTALVSARSSWMVHPGSPGSPASRTPLPLVSSNLTPLIDVRWKIPTWALGSVNVWSIVYCRGGVVTWYLVVGSTGLVEAYASWLLTIWLGRMT